MNGLSTVMAGLFALVSLGAIGTGWLSGDTLRAEKSPQFAKAADVTVREWPGLLAGPKEAPVAPAAAKPVEEAKPAPAAVPAPAPVAAPPAPIAAKPATAAVPKPAPAPKPAAVAAPAAHPVAPSVATAEPAEAAPAEEGTLNLSASDTADIFIDGKKVGSSPVTGKKVKAGKHKVRFDCYDANGETKPGAVQTVEVGANDEKAVEFTCPQ
ncbi:MAG: PEGA domain-containing protein [Myxococcaceae bacterium]|nr:PEGA domain-containing protein [Myxococcaceae bacterium]